MYWQTPRVERLEDRRLLATFLVTSIEDSGPGTLREAIVSANVSSDLDAIEFNISSQVKTIRPLTGLPNIAFPVRIDASTQPGFEGKPLIELDGSLLTASAAGLQIDGGSSNVRGLAIHSFPKAGVSIFGGGGTVIVGNYIGTDLSGQLARPNGLEGVLVLDSVSNRIGGSGLHEGNLLSGNASEGVRVWGVGSTDNQILGNFIGTSADGTAALPNHRLGVLIGGAAAANFLGTDGDGLNDASESNVISGNLLGGIEINNADRNVVAGNWVGLSAAGSSLPNGLNGILVRNSSAQNIIGSNLDGVADELERNVVSGNQHSGIRLETAVGNSITKNFIGTSALGDVAIPNGFAGILLIGNSDSNRIGNAGNSVGGGNLISGNGDAGIRVSDSTLNSMGGNWIGTNIDGNLAVPNLFAGIYLNQLSSQNVIGTDEIGENHVAERNVISGNAGDGIRLDEASHNHIAGNLIGLAANGLQAVPNQERGVLASNGAQDNLIGTNDDGLADQAERNIISGNLDQGIAISGIGTQRNIIAGNYIGTDISGNIAVPNTSTGILVSAQAMHNRVGTSDTSRSDSVAGNLISGNANFGIRFRNLATNNSASGNWIGLGADGQTQIPNKNSGIGAFEAATHNLIGGATPQQRNVISGNLEWGVFVQADSGSNPILGNSIGLLPDGITVQGNGLGGISIDNASHNQVGNGTATGANRIAFPTGVGVAITNSNSIGNSISGNSIYGPWMSAIDLGNDGRTPNDPTDIDMGPNGLQNFPVIDYAASSPTRSQIVGTINSSPNAEFMIELSYASPDMAGSEFLGVTRAVTDGSGLGYWIFSSAIEIPVNATVVATASNPAGSQSEFSDARTIAGLLSIDIDSAVLLEGSANVKVTISRPLSSNTVAPLTIDLANSLPNQIGVPTEVVIPSQDLSVEFVVQILDDEIAEKSQVAFLFASAREITAGGAIELTINDDDLDWHNLALPLDVSRDGFVTPIDALLVVNFLNSNSGARLSGIAPQTPSVMVDTNNDGFASPIDALLVINFLNSGSGEGESTVMDALTVEETEASLLDFLAFEWLQARRKKVLADWEC